MAIYKQVMPGHNNNVQMKRLTSNRSNASVQEDETYEYFSDKEEAEKHRKMEKQKMQMETQEK